MKKNLFRVIAISIVGTMFLSACSSGAGSKDTSKSSDTAAKQIVLKWYTDTDEVSNKTMYKTQEIADAFTAKYPNVKVDVQPLVASSSVTEYSKKVDLMLASNEKMDILYFSGAVDANKKVLSGSIVPLNDYAEKAGINLKEEFTNMLAFDEKYYTVAREDSVYFTFLNKDMLDAAGLPIPPIDWTWDDYNMYAEKLTQGEGVNKVYGSYFHTWPIMFTLGSILDQGFYKADGSANFDNPSFKAFFNLRNKMENETKVSTSYADIKTQNLAYRNEFFGGKVAMMPQGAWLLGDIKDTEKYPHTFKTTFASLPRLDESSTPNATVGSGGSGYAINANCEYKQEAFDLIYFITTYGADLSKSRISAWKQSEGDSVAKNIMGEDESLYDLEAYNKVMDSDMIFAEQQLIPDYDSEVMNVFTEETEKFITGIQNIDDTINNLQKRSTEIINKAKK